ncbi:hypothetical protein BIV57_02030 [Mangrovactinospora gilvigrisea]|uniref:Uncharacterized protein n=1 Tax=Mangrovactinospora gilvigrisea TaxID=1428644 RepID=A0A1J7CC96_9ACTN|nr:hypothetical protein BIV57_02030 [Mangrovactinospora gilvigrisea]
MVGGHRAVLASFSDARINSENWEMHGVKLEAGVKAALKARVLADRRSSGIRFLAEGHYMDAALRALPDDPQAWVAMAKAFQAERFADPEIGKQTTYRVGPVAYELLANLNQAMQELNYGRRGLYVLSAAMERLLQEMDKDGPLTGGRD